MEIKDEPTAELSQLVDHTDEETDEEMEIVPEDSQVVESPVSTAASPNVLATPLSCTACESKREKMVCLQKTRSSQKKRLENCNKIIRDLKIKNALLIQVSSSRRTFLS